MNMQMTNLLSQVVRTLEARFGLVNEFMTVRDKRQGYHSQFFNTAESRVKVCVQHGFNKVGEAQWVSVSVAVEEDDRPGVFFALGDRLHFDLTKFPQFQFHADLRAKLSSSSCSTDVNNGDVLAYAKELCEKL